MSLQSFTVTGRLPTLNEYVDAAARSPHERKDMKKRAHRIVWRGLSKAMPAFKNAHFKYEFFEPTMRFDPSNFVSGAIKCIEDALQEAGVLVNDGWKQVLGIEVTWEHSAGTFPRCKVTLQGETDERTPATIRKERRDRAAKREAKAPTKAVGRADTARARAKRVPNRAKRARKNRR